MSEQEANIFDTRLARFDRMAGLTKWILGALIAAVIFIGTLGMKYQGYQDLEKRVTEIEGDRTKKLEDYNQFKADIRSDVTEMKTDLKWIRSTLEKR